LISLISSCTHYLSEYFVFIIFHNISMHYKNIFSIPHIPQFTERKNRFGKREGQGDGEPVDEEIVVPRPEFAIVHPCECGEDQSLQSTEKSSAWLGGQSAC
jgi:hypothetical protein